jgi:hypothetical protein
MSKIKGRKIVCYSRAAALGVLCVHWKEILWRRRWFCWCTRRWISLFDAVWSLLCCCWCCCCCGPVRCHERKTSQAEMPQGGGERKRITGDYRETQLIGINFSTRNSTHTKTPRSQPYRMLAFLPLLFAALYSASILRLINYFKSYKSERRRWPRLIYAGGMLSWRLSSRLEQVKYFLPLCRSCKFCKENVGAFGCIY